MFRRYPLLFTLLAVGVVAPYELIVLAATGKGPFAAQSSVSSAFVLSLIDNLVVGGLLSALYVRAVAISGDAGTPRVSEVVLQSLRVLPTVVAAQIIATIGIAVGFLAFIIPGIILTVRWAVVAQAAATESENWIEALKRSGELTSGNFLHVAGLILITGLTALGLLNGGIAIAGTRTTAGTVVLAVAVETIARAVMALTAAVLYFDLRARRQVPVA